MKQPAIQVVHWPNPTKAQLKSGRLVTVRLLIREDIFKRIKAKAKKQGIGVKTFLVRLITSAAMEK